MIDRFEQDLAFCPPGICSLSFGSGGGSSQSQENGTQWGRAKKFLVPFSRHFPFPTYSNELESGELRITDHPFPQGTRQKLQPVLDEEGNPVLGEDGVPLLEPASGPRKAPAFGENFRAQQFNFGVPKFKGLEDMDFERLEKALFTRQKGLLDPEFERSRSRTREELSQMGLGTSPVAYGEGGALDVLEDTRSQALGRAANEATIARTQLQKEELARKLGFDMELVRLFENIFNQRLNAALAAGRFGKGQQSTDGGFGFKLAIPPVPPKA